MTIFSDIDIVGTLLEFSYLKSIDISLHKSSRDSSPPPKPLSLEFVIVHYNCITPQILLILGLSSAGC